MSKWTMKPASYDGQYHLVVYQWYWATSLTATEFKTT